MAKLFATVGTGETSVGDFRKTLRMQTGSDFPPDQKQQSQAKQSHGKNVVDEHQGSKHHRIVPIIDAATGAAFVFHKPCLEGAEKQDADHIAHGKGQADE